MARKQIYDYVMNVALRDTLKEFGFTRKTRRDYILERSDRIWIFEVEMAPPRQEFSAHAAVYLPELQTLMERRLPGFWFGKASTRNHSHVRASIPQLMEIPEGHDYYTTIYGNPTKAYLEAQCDPIMRYQERGNWALPESGDPLLQSDEERTRAMDRGIRELGLFIDEQWRAFVPDWYRKCDDPMFVVDWMEKHGSRGFAIDLALAALCHMAADNGRAAFYLRRRIEEAGISYEDLYRELHRHYRGNWLQRLWSRGWSEQKVAELASGRLAAMKEAAEAARKLADGLGIRL